MQALLGFVELSRGHLAESVLLLEPLPTRLRELGYGEPSHLQAIPNLVEAYVELGRPDDARPLLEWYERQSHSLGHPLGVVQAARCSGLLAAASGDVDAALELRRRARPRAAAAVGERPPRSSRGGSSCVERAVARRAQRSRGGMRDLRPAGRLRLWAERARGELAASRTSSFARDAHRNREPRRGPRRRGPLEQGGRRRAFRDRQGRRGAPSRASTASSASSRGPS